MLASILLSTESVRVAFASLSHADKVGIATVIGTIVFWTFVGTKMYLNHLRENA